MNGGQRRWRMNTSALIACVTEAGCKITLVP
jgi:hypothetical protein